MKCDVRGADPKGEGYKQSQRIAKHMSIQITEDDPNWMDDDEKCKMAAGLMGSAFKKTYFDPVEKCNGVGVCSGAGLRRGLFHEEFGQVQPRHSRAALHQK